MHPHPLGHIGLQTPALLLRVGQFLKGIGQFHAAGEELETQRSAGIGRVAPGKRRLRAGPMGEETGLGGQAGFHMLQHEAEEAAFPILIGPGFQPGTGRGRLQRRSIALAVRPHRGQDIEPIAPAKKRLHHGDPAEWRGRAIGPDGAQIGLGLIHQPGHGKAGTVPFQHGEFRCVAGG